MNYTITCLASGKITENKRSKVVSGSRDDCRVQTYDEALCHQPYERAQAVQRLRNQYPNATDIYVTTFIRRSGD